ncbi:hypothetical protein COM24_28545 [Bacillus toyonensis]|uniref:sublancin family glycopeptide n=1 Tax=Bacillus TaxID=1386 RepID=UPI000778214D|nr:MULTISPECIES: sublancin family glycopeptide [Bacillus cereus group]KXY42233.1 hypothetical protein AT265_09775 [Bacillus cereus]MDA1558666.1 hypothetical protein [Bacillus cereus]MDA2253304.1 hypothetical protein [Bacillus cereus]MDA2286702.1 hypothetical protein [Bacillus cereus]MDA2297624.1 hypothetical protein [Bacillus cereus]
MKDLFKELKVEELEEHVGHGGMGWAQCAALLAQCSSAGSFGCGGGWSQAYSQCNTYRRSCNK